MAAFLTVIISSLLHGRSSAPKLSNLFYLESFSSYVHMIPSLCINHTHSWPALGLLVSILPSISSFNSLSPFTNPGFLPLDYNSSMQYFNSKSYNLTQTRIDLLVTR